MMLQPVHESHPVAVVIDFKALMCVDIDVLIILGLLRGKAHKAPDWQLIHE